MTAQNVELLKAMLPGPNTDIASIIRDEHLFASTVEALGGLL